MRWGLRVLWGGHAEGAPPVGTLMGSDPRRVRSIPIRGRLPRSATILGRKRGWRRETGSGGRAGARATRPPRHPGARAFTVGAGHMGHVREFYCKISSFLLFAKTNY